MPQETEKGTVMPGMIARLWPMQDASNPDRRKETRRATHAKAVVTTMQGEKSSGTIGDVSPIGCSFHSDSKWLRVGKFVAIALGKGQPVQAIVRWVRDDKAGMEFLRPITSENEDWLDLID